MKWWNFSIFEKIALQACFLDNNTDYCVTDLLYYVTNNMNVYKAYKVYDLIYIHGYVTHLPIYYELQRQ